jgi:glycogen(starch) synthase
MSHGDVSRVLITADAVGGVWAFACDLARALGDQHVEVSLAVLGPSPSERQRDEVRALSDVVLFERPGRLEWMADPWDDVAASGQWLLDLANALCPDVIHLNGLCHADLPWRVPVIVTGHSCVVSWWRGVHGSDPPHTWSQYIGAVGSSLRAADLVTAPTAAMLTELEEIYGPFHATAVVPNGRYASQMQTAEKEPFVLSAGRLWDEAKNIRAICAAAPLLSWPVRLAGECRSPDGAAISCDGVEFLGRLERDAMASMMARASIYALAARYEPFGLSALEAALAGCALVLGDIRSLREVWGDAALFVAPDSPAVVAAAIEGLIHDSKHRHMMAARAQARARAMTPARMAAQYLAAYRRAASIEAPSAAQVVLQGHS